MRRSSVYIQGPHPWVDVRAMGAIGDGVADDTAAFVSALTRGTPIYVPAGTYKITSKLIPSGTQNVRIIGAGKDVARLRAGAAVDLIEPRGSGAFELHDLTLEGNRIGAAGVLIDYARSPAPSPILLRNVRINGFRTAGFRTSPTGSQAVELTFENCYIHQNGAHGVYVNRAAVVRFTHCRFSGHTTADVELSGAGGTGQAVTFVSPNFDSGGARGLYIQGGVQGVTLINPYSEGKTVADIHVQNCYAFTLIGGVFGSSNLGIHLKNVNGFTLLDPLKNTPYTDDFIRIEDSSQGLLVTREADAATNGIDYVGTNRNVTRIGQSGTRVSSVQVGPLGLALANGEISGTERITRNAVTWDPPSVASGSQITTTVPVAGATPGDLVLAAFSNSLSGLQMTGYVSAPGTVAVVLSNSTGRPVDLASGTLAVCVIR